MSGDLDVDRGVLEEFEELLKRGRSQSNVERKERKAGGDDHSQVPFDQE